MHFFSLRCFDCDLYEKENKCEKNHSEMLWFLIYLWTLDFQYWVRVLEARVNFFIDKWLNDVMMCELLLKLLIFTHSKRVFVCVFVTARLTLMTRMSYPKLGSWYFYFCQLALPEFSSHSHCGCIRFLFCIWMYF